MTSQAAAKARQNFSEIINQVAYAKERVVIERRGKGLAAVVPMEDLILLQELEDRIDLQDARQAIQEAKKHGTTPWDQIKKKIKAQKK